MIHKEILDVFGAHGRFYYSRLFSSSEGLGLCLLRAKTEFSKFFKVDVLKLQSMFIFQHSLNFLMQLSCNFFKYLGRTFKGLL